ncbi:hypothetical protein BDY21DRAFT_278223 [Lineolata rhizophorae]|uniref:DUF7729 domain-containing protein n=1 Tax=Lineolata rhizophorae TaxID=578093 RepID=A0A6A6PBN7_9PEZI|nr:hypothetical protein BDY21DRAFT_278223 [Lineolata rhizophorae]
MLHRNHKRQSDDDEENDDDSSGSTTAGRPSSTAGLPASIVPPSGTSTPSTTVNVDDSLQTASPLPEPFDTSLGKNFTNQGCPDFFSSFLNNDTFQSCMPFSLLLQTSQSFFDASKSSFRITQTLDATCRVDFDTCNVLMDSLAHDIKDDSNCGNDFRNENPMVIQAYDGFVAYRLLYQAGCLKDDRGSYCYANAITNTSSATDSYPYYLPLGVALPGGSRPTCNDCLQRTMEIFSLQAGNETQPVSQTYGNAAQQINMGCGPEFVNTTITDVSDAAVRVAPGQGLLAVLSALLVVGWLM